MGQGLRSRKSHIAKMAQMMVPTKTLLKSAKTKRGRREGDGKNFTTICLAQAVLARRLVWGTGPHPLEPGAVPAPKCNPLREVSASSPPQRATCRQLPSPRGRHCLPSVEARVPLREVVRGQPSRYLFEVVLSQLLREDICQGYHQSRDF